MGANPPPPPPTSCDPKTYPFVLVLISIALEVAQLLTRVKLLQNSKVVN